MDEQHPIVKPCPFCGEQPTIEPWHGGPPTKRMVHCENGRCDVNPMCSGDDLPKALASWNKRR